MSAVHNLKENMMTPGLSKGMNHETLMGKCFGVNIDQMKRTQALIRLGVTDDDVEIAKRLFSDIQISNELVTKEEKILGLSKTQITYFKALEILGTDIEIVGEDRAKRLSELGFNSIPRVLPINSSLILCTRFQEKKY
mmetsp:Transcript_6087/g.9140  ORF Transcript_6087/g.9140 Transcript_6087/m.9140 type:complete len:138 (-) Transcript_6087:280-693(-)